MIKFNDFSNVITRWTKVGGETGTHQRLGQFLINEFKDEISEKLPDSDIFYEVDENTAYNSFYEKYVE